jgi:hypothetical protein
MRCRCSVRRKYAATVADAGIYIIYFTSMVFS